jgi:hypothetical protein
MVTGASVEIPRRQFLAAGCLAPKPLLVPADDLPEHAFKEAATAKITVQPLRRNSSVHLGLPGRPNSEAAERIIRFQISAANTTGAGLQRRRLHNFACA